MSKTLFVIDAYNLIYRMFYAIPEMTTREGLPVNAIFGVAKFLKGLSEDNPDATLIVATDVGRSFREELYPEYKAQRDRMPDNLRSQIDGVFALFDAANIIVLARPGYEADDIIGSIGQKYENNGRQVVIISSDKDLCQFVRDGHVHIYDAMKRKFMKEADVLEKFGVPVHQVCDYLAIVGDASDNIPGIAGFGPKKAVDLLGKYETLGGIYENISELTTKMQETLLAQKDNAFLSQKLATIDTSLDIGDLPESAFAPGLQLDPYIALIKQYEFRSLLPAVPISEGIPQQVIQTRELDTIVKIHSLCQSIQSKTLPIIISTDIYGKIVVGWDGEIYSVDTKKVDAMELIDLLLSETIEISGYDIKIDIKRLMSLQKPLQDDAEGQGRLF